MISDFESIKHPVHFVNKYGKKSPSAFIPFCEFGGNMSAMGMKIDQFSIPVCNSFQAKILNDQLCFEVDLNKFSNKDNIENELGIGFYFLVDYNEDRNVSFPINISNLTLTSDSKTHLLSVQIQSSQKNNASVHLSTRGTKIYLGTTLYPSFYRASKISW